MDLLRRLKLDIEPPERIRVNEQIEIKVLLDSTRLSSDLLEKHGIHLESVPLNVMVRVYSNINLSMVKKFDWRIFDKGKRLSRREELAIFESKLNVPLGSTLSFPIKFNIPQAYPWLRIKFPKRSGKTMNDIEDLDISNEIVIDAEINGIDLSGYFDNVIEFAPIELYDEEKALEFLNKLINYRFEKVTLNQNERKIYGELELSDDAIIKISCDPRYVAIVDNLLKELKSKKVKLFTHVFKLEVTKFPETLPRIHYVEGEYVYRVEIIPKHGGSPLKSEINLSKLSMIIILDKDLDSARRQMRRKKADLFILLSQAENSVAVKWELTMYKSRLYRFMKIHHRNYLFSGLPQPFIYEDVDFTMIGYYVLRVKEKANSLRQIEVPFVLTNK